MKSKSDEIGNVCEELRHVQRLRKAHIRARIKIENSLAAVVAIAKFGYANRLAEADRKKCFGDAKSLIARIDKTGKCDDLHLKKMVETQMMAVHASEKEQALVEAGMRRYVQGLPIIDWINHPDQRGFSDLYAGVLIGELGDLRNYANPAKVWKMMGSFPFTKKGETLAPSTWRKRAGEKKKKEEEGKKPESVTRLSSGEWYELKYSPRKHSVMYIIQESLIKLNNGGPYRARWLEMKLRAHETHPEWNWQSPCLTCENDPEKLPTCQTCGGLGKRSGRANNHAKLVMGKLLLKNFWIEWQHTVEQRVKNYDELKKLFNRIGNGDA
jgi:hypothetical protein